ncbi:hypothetical protein BDQ17DRAFT_1389503 [Cyathus striatus]|nr:hypothetical protein BDQ17DRAFT_1389503 [Cyathus striatus]
MDFATFITQINDALIAENGANLAYLLRPTSPQGKDLVKEFRNPTRASMSRFEGCIQSPWDEIAIQYVLVCTHVAKKRSLEAFKEQAQLVKCLVLTVLSENRGWTLPALFSIMRDLRDLALTSDCMEESARILAKAFGNCMTDRTSPYEESRKWGVYYIVGLIMKCYFRLKRISLSKNILRALDADSNLPSLEEYPRSHQVTYRYYIGMINFLNEDFANAEQQLTLAFYHCHMDHHRNQGRILTYLIPLRILKGHLPSQELLKQYPVLEEMFSPFVAAIRAGDIGRYDKALENEERRLLELNLWITLEKARELCLRGLFRRAWIASDKSTRIPISIFHSALRISGLDVSHEEAECLVANMIYKGFMRGYISHERQIVVLAQTNAFPRLADRQAPFSLM